MPANLSSYISIIIIFQSVLFALVLFTHKGGKKTCNLLLALFLLTIAIQFSVILIIDANLYSENKYIHACIYGFIYGPLLYLYSYSLIFDYFRLRPIHLFHFIPTLLILISTLFKFSTCEKVGILMYLSLAIYVFLAIKKIIDYRKVITFTRSSINKTDLKWLQFTMLIFCFALFIDIVDQLFISITLPYNVSATHLTILFLVNFMFYKGLKQPQIFIGISKDDEHLSKALIKKNYEFDETAETDINYIKNYIEDKKLYKNPEISLASLALNLQMPTRRLSYLINNHLNKNFMSFINDYRIEYAKTCFINQEDSKKTILEVMYESGFNSKSSFNTLFKENTGVTPSEFKKMNS